MDDFVFLKKIKTVLDSRISNSQFRNDDFEFDYNNFKDIIHFSIKKSKIEIIKQEKWQAAWYFNLSPQGAIKLFFGKYYMQQINAFLPDCMVSLKYSKLISIVFQNLKSYIFQNY